MKNKLFIALNLVILTSFLTLQSQAQLLNKLKKKAENAVSKSPDKPADNTEQTAAAETPPSWGSLSWATTTPSTTQ